MSVLAAGNAALTQLQFLADDTDVGDETHKAGPIAVVVVVVLCVACFVLFRSMTKHMRRVREQFPDTEPTVEADGSSPAAPTDAPAPPGVVSPTGAPGPAPKSRSRASGP